MLGHYDTVLFASCQGLLEDCMSGSEGLPLLADTAWAFAQCRQATGSDAALEPLLLSIARHATASMRREGMRVGRRGARPPHHQVGPDAGWSWVLRCKPWLHFAGVQPRLELGGVCMYDLVAASAPASRHLA